jgi:hypothetical protein
MRPRFHSPLKIVDGGTSVEAFGPIEVDDEMDEVYLWVWITPEGANAQTFQASGENERDQLLKAVHATADVSEAIGPTWDLKVEARDDAPVRAAGDEPFKPGKAHARAWAVVLGADKSVRSEIMWTDEVVLEAAPPAA